MKHVEHRKRRVVLAMLASISLHALAFLLFYVLVPESIKVSMYRVYVLGLPRLEEKKKVGGKKKAVSQMEMVRKTSKMRAMPEGSMEFGLPMDKKWVEGVVFPMGVREIGIGPQMETVPELERPEWRSPTEVVPFEKSLPGALEEGITLDIGRKHPLVLIDPNDKKNLKGHLYLPLRRRRSTRRKNSTEYVIPVPAEFLGLKRFLEDQDLFKVHLKGYGPDRYLSTGDLMKYPVVIVDPTSGIRVRRITDLSYYLEHGGFALIRRDRWTFHETLQELQQRDEKRAVLISITLEHPLFHCFYDITRLPGTPLVGIEWGGRLVAVLTSQTSFDLTLNILVYGLIQPGSLGRQYVINR